MPRLDTDDPEIATRFRALDEASRRRLACGMVKRALAEVEPVTLPQQTSLLLASGGVATREQLSELDRRAAAGGSSRDERGVRRSRAIAAARYALSPQPRAPEEALHEALHARTSFPVAIDEVRHQLP
jgi:hypothetical protein